MDARTFFGLEPVPGGRERGGAWRSCAGSPRGRARCSAASASARASRSMEERHRPPVHLGDRAVPLVRAAAGDARARRDRGRARPSDLAGARDRARRRHRDPHRARRARTAPLPLEGQWAIRPDVPGPLDCPPRPMMNRHEGTISEPARRQARERARAVGVPGPEGSGNSALWIRLPELLEMSAAALAIIGDFVPFGIGQALGKRAGGNSLDNTLRVAHRVPTEWVLADVRVHAVADGFGHGLVHLWAEDGTLLGTASQSAIVRAWRDDQDRAADRAGRRRAALTRSPCKDERHDHSAALRHHVPVRRHPAVGTARARARARRPRLHRPVVGRVGRLRRVHPARGRGAVGARAAPRDRDRAGVHTRARTRSRRRSRRCARPRPVGSRSGSARRRT